MKRLFPILLCFLAFAVPRLYGQKTYLVTFSATEGGTLTAQALNPWVDFQSGDQLVAGTNLNFNASANEGYQLEYWEINGERSDLTDYSISLDNLQAPLSVVAHFKMAPTDGYKVHISAVGEGEITAYFGSYWSQTIVKDGDNVPAGTIISFTATPKEGKVVGYWTINDKKGDESYGKKTFMYTVIAETTLSVEFIDPVYDQLTFEATEGAEIEAYANWKLVNSGDSLERGTEVKFTPKFENDYTIDHWEINNKLYPYNAKSRAIEDYKVMGETYVKLFARLKVKSPVTFSAEANGEVLGFKNIASLYDASFVEITSGEELPEETQVILLAKPSEGYRLTCWTLAGDTIGETTPLIYNVVNGDNTIVAHFNVGIDTETIPVHFSAGEGGKLTAKTSTYSPKYTELPVKDGFPIKKGQSVSFSAVPDTLYVVKSWSVNGKKSADYYDGKKDFTYSFNAEDTVRVEFEKFTPRIVKFEAFPVEGGKVEAKNSSWESIKSGDTVPEGRKISVSADKNDGYAFEYWEINGERSNEYKERNIYDYVVMKDVSFKAYFKKLVKLPVTFSANGDGSVEGRRGGYWGSTINPGDTIEEGTTLNFTAMANAEAKLFNWTINGVDTLMGETSISYEVQKNKPNTIVANFVSTAAPKALVTFTYDGEGGLACTDKLDDSPVASGESIPIGKVLKFVATPATGYTVSSWTINGEELFPNQTTIEYTVVEGTNDITAHFTQGVPTPSKVKVTYGAATEGGEVSALLYPASGLFSPVESGDEVDYDSNVFFEADAKAGYEVEKWVINNEEATYAGSKAMLTIVVKENTDVQVYFKKIAPVAEYSVTFSADPIEGGTIKASGYVNSQYKTFTSGESVAESTYIDFEATANEGYEFEKWIVNGVDKTPEFGDKNKISEEITAETNIVAHFKSTAPVEEYTVTFAADPKEGGTITATYYDKANEKEVPFETGAKFSGDENYLTFTAKANDGYQIVSWSANGTDVTPSDPKKIDKLEYQAKAALDLKVAFKKLQKNYVVTLKSNEHGTITIKEDVDLK